MSARQRVERIAREESTAIAVRAVQRMLPGVSIDIIKRVAAQTFAESDATMPRFTDEEIATAPADDEDLRVWWRKTFEPTIMRSFAAAGRVRALADSPPRLVRVTTWRGQSGEEYATRAEAIADKSHGGCRLTRIVRIRKATP